MSVEQNFEQLLNNFFALYHPRQVKKVSEIAQAFKGQEVEVMKSLCDRYKKAYKVVPGLVEALEAPEPVAEVLEEAPIVDETTEQHQVEANNDSAEIEASEPEETTESQESDEDLGLEEFDKKD